MQDLYDIIELPETTVHLDGNILTNRINQYPDGQPILGCDFNDIVFSKLTDRRLPFLSQSAKEESIAFGERRKTYQRVVPLAVLEQAWPSIL